MPTPEPDRIRLVTNLRAARRARGLTPAQLAEASGIADADLIDIVSCDRLPSAIELAQLADALNTTPEELLGQPAPGVQIIGPCRMELPDLTPSRPTYKVEILADVPAGLEHAATSAALDALYDLGVDADSSSVPADEWHINLDEYEAVAKELQRLREFADWLISLDDPANINERATAFLPDIISRARQARGQEATSADHR